MSLCFLKTYFWMAETGVLCPSHGTASWAAPPLLRSGRNVFLLITLMMNHQRDKCDLQLWPSQKPSWQFLAIALLRPFLTYAPVQFNPSVLYSEFTAESLYFVQPRCSAQEDQYLYSCRVYFDRVIHFTSISNSSKHWNYTYKFMAFMALALCVKRWWEVNPT